MLLKNYLIEVFIKASIENNILLKESVVIKWVHRFGIDSLNELLIHSSLLEENQEQISLMDEVNKEENQEQISLMDEVNKEETKFESNDLETPIGDEIIGKKQDYKKTQEFTDTQEMPLPYIKNLRKWINKDKKAS